MNLDQCANIFIRSADLKRSMAADRKLVQQVLEAGQQLKRCSDNGGVIYVCGNGGSACDAMHFVEELVARYKKDRPGVRAMHFMDPSVMSCWSNDHSYAEVFERQARTFCTDRDALIVLSTSGKSENVIRACKAAKAQKALVIGLTGKTGGDLPKICDTAIVVPSEDTERIQEAHITIIHAWCELFEP